VTKLYSGRCNFRGRRGLKSHCGVSPNKPLTDWQHHYHVPGPTKNVIDTSRPGLFWRAWRTASCKELWKAWFDSTSKFGIFRCRELKYANRLLLWDTFFAPLLPIGLFANSAARSKANRIFRWIFSTNSYWYEALNLGTGHLAGKF